MMKEEAMRNGMITEADNCREFVTLSLMAGAMRLLGETDALVTGVQA